MKHRLHSIFNRYLRPAGEDGSDTGGTGTGDVDRGDDFTPTDDKPVVDKAATEKAAAAADTAADEKAAAEAAAAEKAAEEDKDLTDEEKEAKAAAAKADKPKGKDTRVPLARHEEILRKERERRTELEQQLAKYQGGQQVAEVNERITKDETALVALEKEHAKLVVDGDHVKAAETMTKIRRMERTIVEAQAAMATAAAESRAYERVRYETTVERIEAAYPVMNQDHPDYDAQRDAEVTDLANAYRVMGLTPAAALQKAAKTLLGAATAKQTDATEVTPRVDADAAAKVVAAERKAAQVKKNLEASGKQPPATKGVGADSDKAGGSLTADTAIRLPYKDFIKLDDSELARLRGDEL